jgi:hypothetical protein
MNISYSFINLVTSLGIASVPRQLMWDPGLEMLQATYCSKFVVMPYLVLHEPMSSIKTIFVLLALGSCKLANACKLAIAWDEFN